MADESTDRVNGGTYDVSAGDRPSVTENLDVNSLNSGRTTDINPDTGRPSATENISVTPQNSGTVADINPETGQPETNIAASVQNQPFKKGMPQTQPQVVPPSGATTANPVTQKASWIHDIAETLSGGPRYKYDVNPNTGEMEKVKVPVSGKHLGMAIALEAIGGGLTGLAYGKGAGNAGKGGAAAFEQGRQQVIQQRQEAEKRATDDYARKVSIANTNMNMLRNEQIAANSDYELQKKTVDSYADEYAEAQNTPNAIISTGLTEAQVMDMVKKDPQHITQSMFIPTDVIQSVGPDGKPELTPHGAPKFTKIYAQLNPLEKFTPPKDLLDEAYERHIPGFATQNDDGTWSRVPIPSDYKMALHRLAGLQEQLNAYSTMDYGVQNYNDGANHSLHKDTNPSNGPSVPNPEIKDPKLSTITDNAATSHDLPPALLRAITLQESGGNVNVANSKPNDKGVYAVGPFQVTLATAKTVTGNKDLTEEQLKDPETNATIAAQYLSNLIKSNKGDIHKALVNYHGAGADSLGVTGEAYANQVMARVPGLTQVSGSGEPVVNKENDPLAALGPRPQIMDSKEALDKHIILPSDVNTVKKLGGLGVLLDGKYNTKDVMALGEKLKLPSDSVGRVINWLGPGIDRRSDENETTQLSIKNSAGVSKAAEIEQNKTKEEQQLENNASSMLTVPPNFKPNPNILKMSYQDAEQQLRNQGVQIPDNFSDIFELAKGNSNPEDFTPRVYKGVGGILGMNRTLAKSFAQKFLKPGWQEQDYKNKQAFLKALQPEDPRVGGVLYSGGVAAQHLDLAQRLFDNMDNRQSPVWNEAANWLGKNILGQKAPAVYDTIATQLANEVSKVTTGNTATTDTSVEHVGQNIKNSQSPEQAKGNLDALVSLMMPRFAGIHHAAKSWDAEDEYRKYIDPNMVEVFGRRGFEVPGYGKPFQGSDGKLYFSLTGDPKDAKALGQ